jgi:hypothetical protein
VLRDGLIVQTPGFQEIAKRGMQNRRPGVVAHGRSDSLEAFIETAQAPQDANEVKCLGRTVRLEFHRPPQVFGSFVAPVGTVQHNTEIVVAMAGVWSECHRCLEIADGLRIVALVRYH